jgi:hypothetical protein
MAEPQEPADSASAPATRDPDPNRPEPERDNDPMHELLQHLLRAQPMIATVDPSLAQTIQTLAQEGADPARRAQPGFRHQVAYALHDLEKLPVWPIQMSAELRTEMTHLSVTAPGLDNPRMLALMRTTHTLGDKQLIRDIREAATDIGVRADQNTATIRSRIDVLENRIRLALNPAASGHSEQTGVPWQPALARDDPPTQQRPLTGQQRSGGDPLYTILAGMRPGANRGGASLDPSHTPMRDRIAAFGAQIHNERDDRALTRAERSGHAALDALDAFRSGEGTIVMNRIRAASRTEPGGLAAVLAEMRPGGRFADLRQEFNTALAKERGVTAAYDKAAAALARYGQDRIAVEEVIARRPDAANLSAKFARMDAEIGEAAGNIPSRRDAETMVDDLAQKAAELLRRAVDTVKSVFTRSPAPETATRAAPAPSMSP